jgi:hypothetical protein
VRLDVDGNDLGIIALVTAPVTATLSNGVLLPESERGNAVLGAANHIGNHFGAFDARSAGRDSFYRVQGAP